MSIRGSVGAKWAASLGGSLPTTGFHPEKKKKKKSKVHCDFSKNHLTTLEILLPGHPAQLPFLWVTSMPAMLPGGPGGKWMLMAVNGAPLETCSVARP